MHLGALWKCLLERLGVLLGASWGLLGASWRLLGPLGAESSEFERCFLPLGPLSGPSWGSLRPSWVPIVPSWAPRGPSWSPLGSFPCRLWGLLGRLGLGESSRGEHTENIRFPIRMAQFWLLGALLECLLERLGVLWGASRRLLVPLGAESSEFERCFFLWGPSRARLGALQGRLGSLLGRPGPLVGRLGALLGTS